MGSTGASNPFGTRVLPGGKALFRLWAPGASSVALALDGGHLPMQALPEGWYELATVAPPGSLYRFRIDDDYEVPDPASRFQPADVDGPSELIDPGAFEWQDNSWRGRPWREAVLYELHVGTFTPEGTFAAAIAKLPHLEALGVTAVELMPVADFAGRRNWGYDGVLPYAPDGAYGRPEDLKALVQSAHALGLMVFLDVVYNHFGPVGNWLGRYAPGFFSESRTTAWGPAIDFSNRWVRDFFLHNALHWLGEYRCDGLRFDAVHAIADDSPRHILEEIAGEVRDRFTGREIHLVLENDANEARRLGAGAFDAQWNDDAHHACHVLATGESDGYYAAYAEAPARHLARCLAEGFGYQGEISPFSGEPRGEPSRHLPPTSFVNFLQNHDQVGNRAMGERLSVLAEPRAIEALASIVLLAPSIPLLFMGEEWGCRLPFLFFCDFEGEVGEAVRKGRREEFSRFAAFAGADARSRIPDPLDRETFDACVLRWDELDAPGSRQRLSHYKALLELRRREIACREFGSGRFRILGGNAFEVAWGDLTLRANCGDTAVAAHAAVPGRLLHALGEPGEPWSVHWWISA